MQIPECKCISGPNEYGQLFLHVPEFEKQFREMEENVPIQEPWNSPMDSEGILRAKIDESTQFFDASRIYLLERPDKLAGWTLKCIIETKPYFFRGQHGLSVRLHQVMLYKRAQPLFLAS